MIQWLCIEKWSWIKSNWINSTKCASIQCNSVQSKVSPSPSKPLSPDLWLGCCSASSSAFPAPARWTCPWSSWTVRWSWWRPCLLADRPGQTVPGAPGWVPLSSSASWFHNPCRPALRGVCRFPLSPAAADLAGSCSRSAEVLKKVRRKGQEKTREREDCERRKVGVRWRRISLVICGHVVSLKPLLQQIQVVT